jgi:hypothetical protein
MLKNKAKADAKAQHTFEYVSILRRLFTQLLSVRCIFKMACGESCIADTEKVKSNTLPFLFGDNAFS